MSVRAEDPTLILVDTKVEFSAMLDHRGIKRREQDMIIIINLGDWSHQQSTSCKANYRFHFRLGARLKLNY